MSCNATLSSNVPRTEFPDNGPSDFKARLPKDRVWQEEDNRWEVGLSGMCIPPTPAAPTHPKDILVHPATRSSSIKNPNRYLCMYSFVSHDGVRSLRADGTVRTSDILPSSMGVEFIKSITDTVEQRIFNTMPVGDTLYCDIQVGDATVKRKTAMTFRWGGGRSGDG